MGILTHRFVSSVADGPYPTQVNPSNWNEPHSFTGGSQGALLVRDTTAPSSSEGIAWLQNGGTGAVLMVSSSSLTPTWWSGMSRCSSQFDKTGTAVLANITGLSAQLSSGFTYVFDAVLYTTSSSASGVKFAISGTAVASAIIYEAVVYDGTAIAAHTRAQASSTAVGGINTVTAAIAKITGTVSVSTGGTLTVQFAQNSSTVGTSSVLIGSTFRVNPVA